MIHDLVDVEERNRAHPDTFQIPPAEIRHSLKTGQYAKVIFGDQERMWLEVEGFDESGRYVGILKNQPAILGGLNYGDRVTFEARHVCDYLDQQEAPTEINHPELAKNHLHHALTFLDKGDFDMARLAILRTLGHLKHVAAESGEES